MSSREPRNTRENIPGNVFDRQHAQRDSDELHNDLEQFGDITGDSENRRNWEKTDRRTIANNTFTLFFDKSKESLDERNTCLMCMTNHAAGY